MSLKMNFLVSLVLFTILSLSEQQPLNQKLNFRSIPEYRTKDLYEFRGIPTFVELFSDEKREIFHYEQTILIKDSTSDNEVRRCEVIEVYEENEANNVKETLTSLLKLDVQEVNMEKMMSLMNDCDAVDDLNREDDGHDEEIEVPDNEDSKNPIMNGILPGTKWCGYGDIANGYHDLHDQLHNLDRCCRAHDLCPIKILGKDERYNLTNDASYTRSHCLCDEQFYDCLKKDNGWSAKLVGNLYFYAASPKCVSGLPELSDQGMSFIPATREW